MTHPTDLSIAHTADGSATLFSPRFDEHYHSIHGAATESMHVFIRHGLEEKLKSTQPLTVLEMGFGTGLNALLTALSCPVPVHYVSLEAYPVAVALAAQLPYPTHVAALLQTPPDQTETLFAAMHAAPWNEAVPLLPGFLLEKRHTPLDAFTALPNTFDLVFYDAFAPSSQPELWTEAVFADLFRWMKPGGILTTYCAKGDVRRAMLAAGLTVERLQGPPRKREMLRARKPLA